MAKKFRCVKCGNIVDINPSHEVLCCPHCGSRYRNTFYDPYAAQNGGVNQYGAPYIFGSQYGAMPQTTPMGTPVQEATAAPADEETTVAAEETVAEGDEDYGDNGDYYAEDQETAVKRLKGKRAAYAVLLVISFLFMGVVALTAYFRLVGSEFFEGSIDSVFKSGASAMDIIKAPETWAALMFAPFGLAGLAMFVHAAMNISLANIRLKEYRNDEDLSSKLKSGKLAGYAFILIFAILGLAYFALYGCGGFVMAMLDLSKVEGFKLTLDLFLSILSPYAGRIACAFGAFAVFVYACYKLADTNKKYA